MQNCNWTLGIAALEYLAWGCSAWVSVQPSGDPSAERRPLPSVLFPIRAPLPAIRPPASLSYHTNSRQQQSLIYWLKIQVVKVLPCLVQPSVVLMS